MIWQERHSALDLSTTDRAEAGLVHQEAWPSPATGTSLTEGAVTDRPVSLTVESDQLVASGDGLEEDHLVLSWGQQVRIGAAGSRLRLG